MDTTIDDQVAAEMERVRSRNGAATQAILALTLRDVLEEVWCHTNHLRFSQQDLEAIRLGFGLPPRDLPVYDPPRDGNVIQFRPRARVAPNHGGNAA